MRLMDDYGGTFHDVECSLCFSKRLSSHFNLSLKMEEDNDDRTTETKTM